MQLTCRWLWCWSEVLGVICRAALDRGQSYFRDWGRWSRSLRVHTGLRCHWRTVTLANILWKMKQINIVMYFTLTPTPHCVFFKSHYVVIFRLNHVLHLKIRKFGSFTFLAVSSGLWAAAVTEVGAYIRDVLFLSLWHVKMIVPKCFLVPCSQGLFLHPTDLCLLLVQLLLPL